MAAYPLTKWHRAVRVGRSGTVREPASGAFNVTVPPGEDVQAAVDRCPPGGCVLLLPGTHEGPLVLPVDKVVHVFGRGQATLLRTTGGGVLTSFATSSTVDGLIIRCEVLWGSIYCVWISGGRLRLQDCDITSASHASVGITGGADPLLVSCG